MFDPWKLDRFVENLHKGFARYISKRQSPGSFPPDEQQFREILLDLIYMLGPDGWDRARECDWGEAIDLLQ
jgi:hypothetical protein